MFLIYNTYGNNTYGNNTYGNNTYSDDDDDILLVNSNLSLKIILVILVIGCIGISLKYCNDCFHRRYNTRMYDLLSLNNLQPDNIKRKKVKNYYQIENKVCAICLEDFIMEDLDNNENDVDVIFEDNTIVILDVCDTDLHPFHNKCINDSLNNSIKCPICRKKCEYDIV
jgi:hypothetical protein